MENILECFRPQQGLTIMNLEDEESQEVIDRFRPQQGLTIMNEIQEK